MVFLVELSAGPAGGASECRSHRREHENLAIPPETLVKTLGTGEGSSWTLRRSSASPVPWCSIHPCPDLCGKLPSLFEARVLEERTRPPAATLYSCRLVLFHVAARFSARGEEEARSLLVWRVRAPETKTDLWTGAFRGTEMTTHRGFCVPCFCVWNSSVTHPPLLLRASPETYFVSLSARGTKGKSEWTSDCSGDSVSLPFSGASGLGWPVAPPPTNLQRQRCFVT